MTDAYAVNQLVAILARHPDVAEEHIGPLAIDRLQRGVSALDGRDEGAVLRDRRRRRRDRFGTPMASVTSICINCSMERR